MKCTLFRSRPFYLHCVLIDVSTVCYAMTWRVSWCVPPAAAGRWAMSHTGAVTRYEYNPAGQLAKVQYPESQELRDLQEQEARQHGLFWQEGVSGLSNGHLSTGEYTELSRLFVRMRNGSGFLPTTQVFRTEMYTYDANGNRATKTTA